MGYTLTLSMALCEDVRRLLGMVPELRRVEWHIGLRRRQSKTHGSQRQTSAYSLVTVTARCSDQSLTTRVSETHLALTLT